MTPLEELDALHAHTSATRRDRTPVEVGPTAAYVDGIYAIAYGRLGEVDRSRTHLERVRGALASHHRDPVHRTLLAAIEERVAQAQAKRSWEHLGPDLLHETRRYDRVTTYKLERAFGEMSLVTTAVDAHSGWDSGAWDDSRRASTLRGVGDGELPERVAAQIATGSSDELVDALAALSALPEADAMTHAMHALRRIAGLASPERVVACGFLLAALVRFGWGELAPRPAAAVVSEADLQQRGHVDAAHTAVAVLGRFGMLDELRALSERLASFDGQDAVVARGAARLWLGEGIGDAWTPSPKLTRAQQFQFVRKLARAVAVSPVGIDKLRELHAMWSSAMDSFGTCTHLCITAVGFVDSLASAIVLRSELAPP